MRVAHSSCRGQTPLEDGQVLASQPTFSRLVDNLSSEDNRCVLREAICESAIRRVRMLNDGRRRKTLTLDVDSLPVEVHGHQPGSEWNGHYGRRIYHPLIASCAETGDLLDAVLRPGQVGTAEGGLDFILTQVDRCRAHLAERVMVRFDAGFPDGQTLSGLDARGVEYMARIRNNAVLNRMIDRLSIDTIRVLSMDAVQQANSGHPGTPMALAPLTYVIWERHLRHDPRTPDWIDRDRFILSAGHASMLLYSMLHLTGYDLPLKELKDFRQWGSRTPGHPEYGLTPGVETTTGPLGQGIANAVGMALAERHLAARFNRPDHEILDHYTYAVCSDGDLMEGVSSEAASLAGHLKLGKLVCFWDDNDITIEGDTNLTFSEDVLARFEAYGWHTARVEDGNDLEAIDAAIREAKDDPRPSMIGVRTVIGYGSPNKAGTADAHGAPLGEDEVARTKENLGWPATETFHVPEEVREHMGRALDRGAEQRREWHERWDAYASAHPELADRLSDALERRLPAAWDADLPTFHATDKPMATRAASGKVLNAIAAKVPWLLGGSADLGPSNKTLLDGEGDHSAGTPEARNLRFGVREHGMGSVMNGMSLHGG
ncbi:MAG TPA: transposase, partial [Longimicrobiales bacterium]|nr:transposase [Longimicrobiales bacterium]